MGLELAFALVIFSLLTLVELVSASVLSEIQGLQYVHMSVQLQVLSLNPLLQTLLLTILFT